MTYSTVEEVVNFHSCSIKESHKSIHLPIILMEILGRQAIPRWGSLQVSGVIVSLVKELVEARSLLNLVMYSSKFLC